MLQKDLSFCYGDRRTKILFTYDQKKYFANHNSSKMISPLE